MSFDTTRREVHNLSLTVASGASVSAPIYVADYVSGKMRFPDAITGTHIAIQPLVDKDDASSGLCYDAAGDLILVEYINGWLPIPTTWLEGCRWMRLVTTNSSGVAQNQAAERAVTVTLKS